MGHDDIHGQKNGAETMKTLVVIVGPTASGKTESAITLAKALNTEILSCDSRQFYKELNIGVARPTPEELSAAPHHFIANRSVTHPYNAYQYEHEALDLLKALFTKNDTMIAVGGSGLYIDALCTGINYLPDPTPELRDSLSKKIANGGLPEILDKLQALDPEYYAIVDKQNPIRVQRAMETIITAGCKYSELLSKPLEPRPFRIVKIGIKTDRDELRQRISLRTERMIEQGLLNEVSCLQQYRGLNTLNTVGYKELFSFLDNFTTLQKAVTEIKNHTWQYAKKQLTWLARYNDIHWVERNDLSMMLSALE